MSKIGDAFKAKMFDGDAFFYTDDEEFKRIIQRVWDETQPEGITAEIYKTVSDHLGEFTKAVGEVNQYRSLRIHSAEDFTDVDEEASTRHIGMSLGHVNIHSELFRQDDAVSVCSSANLNTGLVSIGSKTLRESLWDF